MSAAFTRNISSTIPAGCAPTCAVADDLDDHEVVNDYAGFNNENYMLPTDVRARRAAAYQAYYEHMPVRLRSRPRGPDMHFQDNFQCGDLLAIALTNGRQYRDDQACQTPKMVERRKPQNFISLGGDMQSWWIIDLKPRFNDEASPVVGAEFVTTSITAHSYAYGRFSRMLQDNPHIKFFDDRQHGHTFMDVTKDRWTATIRSMNNIYDLNTGATTRGT